jgi:hypothetical protein
MKGVDLLPFEIKQQIKVFMWGNSNIFKQKLKIVLESLPQNVQLNLAPIQTSYYKNTIWDDVEDNLFCHQCGEKTLYFPFHCNGSNGSVCIYCLYL